MVGTSWLPVIAARQLAASAFQFLAMEPSAFQLYQTGLDSPMAPPFICTDVSALPSHGGIHAAMRSPLSPNAISAIAFLLNATAAFCLFERYFLIAIVFVAVGGVADALDGIVARVQGKESRFGNFLDHCLDRISDTLLAACWL